MYPVIDGVLLEIIGTLYLIHIKYSLSIQNLRKPVNEHLRYPSLYLIC